MTQISNLTHWQTLLIKKLVEEYNASEIHPMLSNEERRAMRDAVRGVAVRMDLYSEFCELLK